VCRQSSPPTYRQLAAFMSEGTNTLQRFASISEPTPNQLVGEGYAEGPQGPTELSIPRRAPGAAASLSFAQQQIWLHAQLAPEVPFYNEVLILERSGALDRESLERSFGEIICRHEILRTSFPCIDGNVVPAVSDRRNVKLSFTELNTLPERQRAAEVSRIITEEARQPFDLANDPLMRARLLRLSEEHYFVVVTLHDLVADEWSLGVISRELDALYQAYSAGEPSPFSDVPVQYADWALWHRNRFEGDVFEQHISYWRKRLAGIPAVLELPTDRPRPPIQRFRGARQLFVLSKRLSESLKELSEREGATLFETLLAAFQTLLLRHTGQSDVVVGAIVPGREGASMESLIGPFAHTVVFRADMESDPTFRELLWRVKDLSRRDCEYQSMPFDRLVSELQPGRDPSRNPLFQALFSLNPSTAVAQLRWERVNFEVDNGAAKVDLQLQLDERPEGIFGGLTYNTDLFDGVTISRMAGHLQTLLQGIVANPDQHLSRLPLLSGAERQQLLVEWNDTTTDYPRNVPLHQFIEEQVERTPSATALIYGSEWLSYRELNSRANQLAHRLRKLGVGPDVLVAVCAERSIEMVLALLAVVKAGGAYVPLDPDYPRERLVKMLEDSKAPVLLIQEHLLDRVPQGGLHVIRLDRDWPETESTENLPAEVNGKNLAYVIYTSGSTGQPKGVPNVHEGIVNRLLWMQDMYKLGATDRVLQKTPYSFDVSVWEFFWPFMTGAALVVARPNGHKDPAYLAKLIADQQITTLHFVPSMLSIFLETEGLEHCHGLRRVFASGEALPFDLQQRFFEKLKVELHNLYGPTEAAVDVTYWACQPDSKEPVVPIGKPIANIQIYILDATLQPVPIGVAGELHIGGIGLARGYLNRPELTAEKFIANPFSREPGARLYKTGDLARFRTDGNVEYLGRIDHQVKLRGFRIELGEIEALLGECAEVRHAAVIVREDVPGNKYLVAYLVPTTGTKLEIDQLRARLKQKVPEFMVPSNFVVLEEFPMTTSGKVDRRALPVPDQSELAPKATFVAPRDVIESQLVQIWETVLGVHPIGVRHNFFELGGHSLVAVRLVDRIEHEFGKKLPIATLLQAPTIEQLAVILRQEGWSPSGSSLVPFQTSGSKTPFFCVHGAHGTVVRFHDLARYLGSDQPFYGLQAQGLDGKHSCHTRTQDMASHYVMEMRAVQPEGPYFIGGYSFGGVIAFEMAQQLAAQGQEAIVFLFDAALPIGGALPQQEEAASTSSVLLKLFQVSAPERRTYLSRMFSAAIRPIQRWVSVARLPREHRKVRKICLRAHREYVPQQSFAGRVILFRSSQKPLRGVRDPHLGWSTYVSRGLEVYEIEGNHENILLEPQVRCVAEQLKICLDEAQVGHQVVGA
jgi:amino acid adenylation domain-containing protein